jgi:adenylate cyclase
MANLRATPSLAAPRRTAGKAGLVRWWQRLIGRIGPTISGLAALVLALLAAVGDPVPLERARILVFDTYQRAAPWEGPARSRVAVVDIDEESIRRLGQWPWPRTDLARLTQRLAQAGARVVAFDIVFSEADRTSPEALARRYAADPRAAALAQQLLALPSHDARLAESFARVPVVLGYFFLGQGGRDVEPRVPFTLSGTLPSRDVPSYAGALLPLPVLERAAAGIGFVSLQGDADGIVRRVPLVALQGGTLVPGLTLEAVRLAGDDASSPNLLASDGTGETLASPGAAVAVRLGSQVIPVTDAGEMWVHFSAQPRGAVIPAHAIIEGTLGAQQLAEAVRGRIVFVGGSAEGLQDLVATPLSPSIAGVTLHAAAAEQILAGHFLERPDWARPLELVLAVLAGAALALLLPRLGAAPGALVAAGLIGAVALASWLAFTRSGYLLDPVVPVLAIAVVYAVVTVAGFWREERQRRFIHAAFDRYLSPELVRRIAADPGQLELGGEERDMSVLMCDIRGFSRISERMAPREVIEFLIAFLTPMSEILLAHKATLDKYIGDAVLAFWNAPLDDPDHPENAARAALAMVAEVRALNLRMAAQDAVPWPGEVKIGIGLNTGTCCVGNMGSRERLSYTLIGDTVNLAARLEGLTKVYDVPIVVGEALAARLGGFALIELDRVRVVGRDAPTTVLALLGDAALAAEPGFARLRERHAAMLTAYRAGKWEEATAVLAEAEELYRRHALAGLHALYVARIGDLARDPPAQPWDGVFAARSK